LKFACYVDPDDQHQPLKLSFSSELQVLQAFHCNPTGWSAPPSGYAISPSPPPSVGVGRSQSLIHFHYTKLCIICCHKLSTGDASFIVSKQLNTSSIFSTW